MTEDPDDNGVLAVPRPPQSLIDSKKLAKARLVTVRYVYSETDVEEVVLKYNRSAK